MWLNSSSATNHFHSGDKQLHTKSSRYTIQLGGPLSKWSSGGNDQGLLGITAGLGRAKSSSYSASSITLSLGSVEGYNLGLYNIWYANNKTKLGPYVGLLTQYSFFKNQIKMPGDQVATNYRSYLLTNTLESGYTIQLIEKEKVRFSIQPNMKVSSQRASGLTHQESTGTQITIKENSSIATKLGVRTALEFDVDTSSAKKLQVSPSFEANWKHNRTSEGVWLNHTHVTPQGYRHIAELKLGIESKISNNLQLWANVGQQFGQHKYAETQAIIGGNYHF
ncbi:autotransporter outer membrane beta-barrel domain-containing protein [Yersinia bercovieri]|nr:autotransporter outer membrane beta-barrel domain-containing protein [Yersinia bercovieri]